MDQFSAASFMLHADLALKALYEQGLLQQWKTLHMLFELVLLVCPKNMNTESGFSRMKFAETTYQSNFNCETQDSIRIIQEVLDRESLEIPRTQQSKTRENDRLQSS